MNERQLMARYRELERLSPDAVSTPKAPALGRAQPTLVHRQTVELLDELLQIVATDTGPFAAFLRMVRKLQPALLTDLAEVPEDRIVYFMHGLGRRMLSIGQAPAPAPVEVSRGSVTEAEPEPAQLTSGP